MADKKKKRTRDQYQLPSHVEKARQATATVDAFKPRPRIPQRRMIFGVFGVFLLAVGVALSFWLPPRSLVQDLRSQGVTVAATVTGVDNKPKYVKVRFVQGPESGTEVKLTDYVGMYPDAHTGDSMLVTYDPEDPSRILAQSWVADPPANLPAYGTSAIALLLLAGVVAVVFRRRWILRTWPQQPSEPARSETPGSKSVRLDKF
ncbi:hypothetical protein [Streptomyces sp. P17]|uniref:hypothetical protein n=1 Tax=Streptomyces sp. P17 TaxID=3074716 RepID=UPI0028F455C7|nr:hypothetical protein [Streptomyces sp. P17]MDT9701468.1 hypothetical protein [Streptomyces sp. P17]